MDLWNSSQPSLSLDLHVGLPPMGHHHHRYQAAPPMVKPKILAEENFLPRKKDPEVRTYIHPSIDTEQNTASKEDAPLFCLLFQITVS